MHVFIIHINEALSIMSATQYMFNEYHRITVIIGTIIIHHHLVRHHYHPEFCAKPITTAPEALT